jgi:hypothetical protein
MMYDTQLSIESRPGVGTKVSITLPRGEPTTYEGCNVDDEFYAMQGLKWNWRILRY